MSNPEINEQKERVDNFIKDYGELVKKYDIDFAAYPMFVPAKERPGVFETVIQMTPVDTRAKAVESPFIPTEKK